MKVMTIFGTRPEAIKMAPVVKELLKHKEIETKVCLTAQHREMLDQVVDLFQLPVDYDLDIMKSGQTLYDITARVLRGLEEVLKGKTGLRTGAWRYHHHLYRRPGCFLPANQSGPRGSRPSHGQSSFALSGRSKPPAHRRTGQCELCAHRNGPAEPASRKQERQLHFCGRKHGD